MLAFSVATMSTIDPAIMKLGQEGYMLCQACHGVDGKGMPNIAPPLANSEWVLGPAENLIRMQFRGLQGPITVNGQEWNSVMAGMGPALGTDEKLAAVITYIRNSWGNEAGLVSADQVAPYRSEIGQPMLTVADLIDPASVSAEPAVEPAADATIKPATEEAPQKKDSASELKENSSVEKIDAPKAQKTTSETISVEPAPQIKLQSAPQGSILPGFGFIAWVVICLIPVVGGLLKKKQS